MVEDNETRPNDDSESEPQDKPSNQEKPIIIPEPSNDWDDYQTEEAPPPKEKKKRIIIEPNES